MIIHTAQYKYKGKDRLDITVKGQDPLGKYFAPTWSMVNDLKSGSLSEKEYIYKYNKILKNVPFIIWKKLLNKDVVTLVCFCSENQFCHRFLLAKKLIKKGAIYEGERFNVSYFNLNKEDIPKLF